MSIYIFFLPCEKNRQKNCFFNDSAIKKQFRICLYIYPMLFLSIKILDINQINSIYTINSATLYTAWHILYKKIAISAKTNESIIMW
ncbi:MAG: hypothetical protein A2176_08840 [Spirochaetes bacterium RBG_13_51_14]|nr:MAG: hypothetical protein A2176_08840 [Spirochaetes bacterium RBG_13_51_14]